ncbi:MAG: hypothetical protein GEU68_10080 [Actinobacteria bacterium]|nr:hypothetical protein [Actinomycetota bacterium]
MFGAIADQVLSSLTNYVVLLAALRSLSVTGIGRFTLAYTSTLLTLIIVRSLVLEPLTVRYTVVTAETRRKATADAAGTSLGIGLLALLATLTAAATLAAPAREIVVSVGLILPVLLLQDAWRLHHFASGRPWAAALNDATCLLFTLVATVIVLQRSDMSVALLLLAWGLGTFAGVIVGIIQCRTVPNLLGAPRWLLLNRDLGPHLAGERIAATGVVQVSLVIVAAVAGTHALGQLGASRTLMAPVTTLVSALAIFAVPEAARLLARTPERVTRFTVVLSIVIVSAVGLIAVLAMILPNDLGQLFAGDNWSVAKLLLLPVAVWTAASGARQGPSAGLRALDRGRTILTLSVVGAPIVLIGSAAGAYLGAGAGAAWGFAIVQCVATAMWWIAYLRAVRGTSLSPTGNQPSPLES